MAKGKLIIIEISIINIPFLDQNIFLCFFTNIGTIKNPIIVITSPPVPAFVLPERVPNSDANDPPTLSARDNTKTNIGLYSLKYFFMLDLLCANFVAIVIPAQPSHFIINENIANFRHCSKIRSKRKSNALRRVTHTP